MRPPGTGGGGLNYFCSRSGSRKRWIGERAEAAVKMSQLRPILTQLERFGARNIPHGSEDRGVAEGESADRPQRIDTGRLPAIRIGRRVRVRQADLDRILAQGTTVALEPHPTVVAPSETLDELAQALERSRRLLGRRIATRRAELAEGLRELSEAVATVLRVLSGDPSAPQGDTAGQEDPDVDSDALNEIPADGA